MALCSECARPIVWAATRNGKRMPLDAAPGGEKANVAARRVDGRLVDAHHITADRPLLVDEVAFTPHWATCPAVDRFRGTRKHTPAGTKAQAGSPALF